MRGRVSRATRAFPRTPHVLVDGYALGRRVGWPIGWTRRVTIVQFVDSPSTYRKRMMAIVIGMVLLAIACGSGDAEPEKPRETGDRQAVVRWVHDDIT